MEKLLYPQKILLRKATLKIFIFEQIIQIFLVQLVPKILQTGVIFNQNFWIMCTDLERVFCIYNKVIMLGFKIGNLERIWKGFRN
jgi:hypothetical protein